MGGGIYSFSARATRATDMGYHTKSAHEIFQQRSINNAMDPYGLTVRESRDSEEHPRSKAVLVALDVTGSMGSIPHQLVKDGLPSMMESIIQKGEPDPQVLFLGIGDHQCDQAPLQVGQYESSDELLDKWLTDVYLEGGGGANDGESYLLTWYLAGFHTSIDCFEKRGEKGFLFTIGDEPTLRGISSNALKRIMGEGQYEDLTASQLLEKASEMYQVYHIHVNYTRSGSRKSVLDGWVQLLRDNVLVAESNNDIPRLIAETVTQSTLEVEKPVQAQNKPSEDHMGNSKPEEILL